MANSEQTANTKYYNNNMQEVLKAKLQNLYQQSPESFSKPIYVLPAIDGSVDSELAEQLQQENKDHTGTRIILIPYFMDNSYWTGILIEFQQTDKIIRSEYINPLNGSNGVPDRLKKQIATIYPSVVVQKRDLLKHNDPQSSATLTIMNLLKTVASDQFPNTAWSDRQKNPESTPTSTTHIPKEGNEHTLQELEQKFYSGLAKRNIKDAKMLSKEIEVTSERINIYEEEEKTEDVDREMKKLTELKELKYLWDQISQMTPEVLTPSPNPKSELLQLEENLTEGLAKLKVKDKSMLPEKIQNTQNRIKRLENEERTEDAQKEKARLNELQELQKLVDEIVILSNNQPLLPKSNDLELRQLEERLNEGLIKLKVKHKSMLPERIQNTQSSIKEYEDEERIEDAEKEKARLNELQDLQKLADEIVILTKILPLPPDPKELKLQQLEERLNEGLIKLKVKHKSMLPERIQNTQSSIKEYEDEERAEDAQKEKARLNELQELQKLVDEIVILSNNQPLLPKSNDLELRQLEERLNEGLIKLKVKHKSMLPERIQSTRNRIKKLEDEERTEDAEKEKARLNELQDLQKLADEIVILTKILPLPPDPKELKLQQLEERLNEGLIKLKVKHKSMLPERIQSTRNRIKKLEDEERTEDAEKEKARLNELQDLQKLVDEIVTLSNDQPLLPKSNDLELRQLEERLNEGLVKLRVKDKNMLPERIQNTQNSIKDYEDEERAEDAEKEMVLLRELQELQALSEKIGKLTPTSTDNIVLDEQRKKVTYIKELRNDIDSMPLCARKTVMECLVHYEERLLDDSSSSQNDDLVFSLLQKLLVQLKREELLSEDTKAIFRDLQIHSTGDNCSLMVSCLSDLLKKIRALNVPEIERLVVKAKEAAELIHDKDIILMIGETGAGKSTTIQFLAGAKMQQVEVRIGPGKFLKHVTAIRPFKNPDLEKVIANPQSRSETRYIAPVTVQLKDIFGPSETDTITICDAPGFEDTAGPEVDISNGIGIIEALKETKSVTILALSSFKGIGDRGQGIQKLAHMLINMVHGIEKKLDAVVYAFTKFPEDVNVNALLTDIKACKLKEDPRLRHNTAFVALMNDMIEKTEETAHTIYPVGGNPKTIIKKLKGMNGIKFPGEVFQCSMAEKTRASIADHVQKDKFGIFCAMKHKDYALILYYLNDLTTLNDLIKESSIQDTYEDSIRFVSENISEYCTEIVKKFNRALVSQDGLEENDIVDYKTSVEYLKQAQILKEHLGSSLLSPEALTQNIVSKLKEISDNLNDEDLHSPLVEVYLDNVRMLKNSFKELDMYYDNSCKKFEKRFEELSESARDLIQNNDFKQLAEILLNISKCSNTLQNHLGKQVEAKYTDIVTFLLRYLHSFSEKAEPILTKLRLNNEEVELLKNYLEILRTAKDSSVLQERVFTYLETSQKKVLLSEENSFNQSLDENVKDLNTIYEDFITKIINYFNGISERIAERFVKDEDQALEYIEKLVNDMEALRTIPELESKTSATYYRTVESVRSYMEQLKRDAEQLLVAIDQQSGITNFRHLARSLSRLKNAEWINRVSPGAYETLMRRITEELDHYACQLEERLMKIDFSLKYPENVSVAFEIVEKIESTRSLERSIPELKKYRTDIVERFLQCTQSAFDRIQKTFNLQDKDIYKIKQELKHLEEIKKEYENLHPARIYLQKKGYQDIGMLDQEIENLKTKQRAESKIIDNEQQDMKSKLQSLDSIVRKYMDLSYSSTDTDTNGKSKNVKQTSAYEINSQAEGYLKSLKYSSIEEVYEQIAKTKKSSHDKLQRSQDQSSELNTSVRRLESIKNEHSSLSTGNNLLSTEELEFLQSKGFSSYEQLYESIKEKTKVIIERGKNKQSYYFSERLDASTANNALVYINQCEKVDIDRVKENAADTSENLKKYIQEYGSFLKQEIGRNFDSIRTPNVEGGPFQYSPDLEVRLQELSSLSKFPHVVECINGIEKIEHWQREFLEYHRTLSTKMEENNVYGKIKELRDQLTIAQALSCVDRFCVNVFAENGFRTLFGQYQGKMHSECKLAYRTVLEYISKGDYANVDITLSGIEDTPLNAKDLAQIKHDLHTSLNKLMKDTKSIAYYLDGKIEREADNRDQIKEINENTEKLRTALNKHSILNLLDDKTQSNLQNFDNEVSEILSSSILKGLNSIEGFMNADSFTEAEQGMENLSRVQRQLAGYSISSSVTEKNAKISESLSHIVTNLMERNDFSDINKYAINPPKDLLDKLKAVASHGSARYIQAYTSMLGKITHHFNLAIEDARKASANERSLKIRSLNYALTFLPENLQAQYKLQIEQLSKFFDNKEKTDKHDLDRLFTMVDEDEHSITKLGLLAERYQKENLNELFQSLREQCLRRLTIYRNNVQKLSDEQNIQPAIDIVKKIIKYQESVGPYISEVKGICNTISILIMKNFSSCCDTLANISSIEQTQIVEKAFSDILIFLDFSNTFDKNIHEFLSKNMLENGKEALEKMFQYLYTNSKNFQLKLDELNIHELQKVMLISKKWDNFLQKIKQCRLKDNLIQNMLKDVKDIIPYTDMVFALEKTINDLQSQLNVEFINEKTKTFEVEREKLFSNIMKAMNTLKEISFKFKDILSLSFDINVLQQDLKKKVEKMNGCLIDVASKGELASRDAEDFRMYYNHIVSFKNRVTISGIDTQLALDQSKNKIFEKVTSLRKEAVAVSSDATKVSNVLVKMKFLAENIFMFDKDINAEIDEALKTYKEKQGNLGIMSLSAELEKKDIGTRVISEHACLSGEDRRLIRGKMQFQDDLDYALGKLTGDDLAIDVLRARYKVFKDTYTHLVFENLKLLSSNPNQEPDLIELVTQTKHLVGSVTHTGNSVTWNRSFKDDIPVLLAHIFAVWTLKNTQHYNSMRGVDAAQAYLLMPHVGQIIAIFRLLGIGYTKDSKIPIVNVAYKKTISDDLINNLVEVGTGEGKSVILAITSCVFALTGVDVNCSCYSDVLSTRDKSDFTSVFRALGIEDRIEYGTFNKLCEQLLNEQCNVRETVRDMIINNKSSLPATDTSARIRPKILLIDEVDVFLSDKYYGGMYTPAVYLKSPSIKILLDSIWQTKTLKTLDSAKTLPAYQTCVTQYSNWIYLFDEAIKDMIAALKSYQSSTYIVQNDKIVYVDGESIVDNVVRGYDTIWAYYHENQKGNISQSSLDDNVGIIINCGAFSYAEMPHDFAYIGGVTGTLKTLAKPEKEILKKVYAIHKASFIPSVFGSSNRTFTPTSDVRVLQESEYFMEIRGEIDVMRNAKRSILVFFESEEKLMSFYNSAQMSSLKESVQIIMEKVSVKDRELCIKHATTVEKVTLLTRTFGRGTDFICRNPQLLANGGIHVLQTFFSEELSEEYQIMGRGARQGDKGSYRMILLDKDLEWVLGSSWKEELSKVVGSTLYQTLNSSRNVLYESKCGAKELGIEQGKKEHKASKDFMTALCKGDIATIKKSLGENNRGANLVTDSRTVLLMDATGSMSSLLSAAKETVCTMFERASIILKEKGLPTDAFQMQFAIYRNYSSKENKILQTSAWTTKATYLREFMASISPEGGMGEEAIEIGLLHVAKESEGPDTISQVILIGDAPANSEEQVKTRRTHLGEKYWATTRFDKPTYYASELQKLKAKNIPVHAFYLNNFAKPNFEEIARETSGTSRQLNIQSTQGAETLTHFVTEEVLRKTAGDQGEAAVNLYRMKFVHL